MWHKMWRASLCSSNLPSHFDTRPSMATQPDSDPPALSRYEQTDVKALGKICYILLKCYTDKVHKFFNDDVDKFAGANSAANGLRSFATPDMSIGGKLRFHWDDEEFDIRSFRVLMAQMREELEKLDVLAPEELEKTMG